MTKGSWLLAPGFGLSLALCAASIHAQRGPAHEQASSGEIVLTARSANVAEPGNDVRFRILRWSTDDERAQLIAALNPAPAPAPAVAGDRGGAARGGRAGRGARGRGRGDGAAAPLSPTAALTTAIGRAPTVGYIWTNDVTGYSIKYAWRAALPDGGERIILATDRRFGAHSSAWMPVAVAQVGAGPALTDYEFTLIEMRLDSKGLGEAKTSLTAKVIVDNEAKTVALDGYTATPAIFQKVKR